MSKKTYKVIQWSSGNVGQASIRGICNRSDLELVGLIVSNEEKNGIGEAELVFCAGLKKGDPGGSYGGQGALSFRPNFLDQYL